MKKILFLLALILPAMLLFAQETGIQQPILNNTQKGGIGIGTILAIVASWSRNKSIRWAILHAMLGWLYVIYFVFTRSSQKTIATSSQ